MKLLRTAPLTVAALLTTLFVVSYVKTILWLWDGGRGLDTDESFPRVCYDLRNDIKVIVWRALPEFKTWAHSGWGLFCYFDAPEGSFAVLSFPSWYLLIPLAALWGYALFVIYGRDKHPRGFTLIELLVVVAAIALPVALLFHG